MKFHDALKVESIESPTSHARAPEKPEPERKERRWQGKPRGKVPGKIPGAEQVAWQGDGSVSARIKVGLGPINGTFGMQAQSVEQAPPNHLKLAINRQGAKLP